MRRTFVALAACLCLLACRGKGPEGPDIQGLVADLRSADPAVSGKANLALVGIGEPAVAGVADLLKDPEARVRAQAATTLWGMGAKARAAVPPLAAVLADADLNVRVAGAMALENMGPGDAKAAVAALIKALNDKEGRVRQWAARALGKVGPEARDAIPALTQALKFDPVRPAAEEALQKIQGH